MNQTAPCSNNPCDINLKHVFLTEFGYGKLRLLNRTKFRSDLPSFRIPPDIDNRVCFIECTYKDFVTLIIDLISSFSFTS